MLPDYYALLGVPENASSSAIRKAYLRLAREHHPDVNKSSGAEEFIKRLNAAYEVLGNSASRRSYDFRRQQGRDESARKRYESNFQSKPPPPPPPPPKREPPAWAKNPPPPPQDAPPVQQVHRPASTWSRTRMRNIALLVIVATGLFYWVGSMPRTESESAPLATSPAWATYRAGEAATHRAEATTLAPTVALPAITIPSVTPTSTEFEWGESRRTTETTPTRIAGKNEVFERRDRASRSSRK